MSQLGQSIVLTLDRSLPVYPDKQTFSASVGSGQPVAAELWTSVTDHQGEAW
jgi:hypothetical protein